MMYNPYNWEIESKPLKKKKSSDKVEMIEMIKKRDDIADEIKYYDKKIKDYEVERVLALKRLGVVESKIKEMIKERKS